MDEKKPMVQKANIYDENLVISIWLKTLPLK
jgi:hypothetical protein